MNSELTGFEPATFCVTGRYSNQLSYNSLVQLTGYFDLDSCLVKIKIFLKNCEKK